MHGIFDGDSDTAPVLAAVDGDLTGQTYGDPRTDA